LGEWHLDPCFKCLGTLPEQGIVLTFRDVSRQATPNDLCSPARLTSFACDSSAQLLEWIPRKIYTVIYFVLLPTV